jgi:hypothetical protein
MLDKKMTDYPEIPVAIKSVNGECTVYLNFAACGDLFVDGLKKTDRTGFTHEYERKFPLSYFQYRLRDSEFEQLSKSTSINIKTRSYLYEMNQAFVSRKTGTELEFAAFLFKVELNPKDNSYKSKTFRALMSLPKKYDAEECYTQVLKSAEEKASKTKSVIPRAAVVKEQSKVVQNVIHTGLDAKRIVEVLVGLQNAGFGCPVSFDGLNLNFNFSENSQGN